MRSHPIGFFAHEECNWSHAGRNHPPLAGSRIVKRSGMRRQPSPTDRSGKAELVQPLGIVVRNASAENVPLPGTGGNFKSLQLSQHVERGAFSLHLTPGRDMLPAQQPAHELCRCHGLDLLAQRGHRQPVNTSQQPPLTPLVLRFVSCGAGAPAREVLSVNCPRSTEPLASIRSNAFSTSAPGSPSKSPS